MPAKMTCQSGSEWHTLVTIGSVEEIKTSSTPPPSLSLEIHVWIPVDQVLYNDEPVEETEGYIFRNVQDMYPEWHARASCLGEDESVFFGSSSPDERPAYTLSDIKKARTICHSCPVFEDCLRQAIRNREAYGVWAGTTMKERNKLFGLLTEHQITEDQIVEYVMAREGRNVRNRAV